MAVLFLLLAVLILVVLAATGIENNDASTVTLLDRSFGQLTEGQLLVAFAGLGFLVALFLFLAFGASRTRRARRKELKSRRRDAEGRVDELERENARLRQELTSAREELDTLERSRADAIAERDRAEAAADRTRANDREQVDTATLSGDRTGATALDDRTPGGDRPGVDDRATTPPPEPSAASRERLSDRTDLDPAREEHASAADEHARAADEEARRR